MGLLQKSILITVAVGLTACVPATNSGAPNDELAARCADASGFTKRAKADPAYKTGSVFATDQELAYINRCVANAGGSQKPWVEPVRKEIATIPGNLPFPIGYPLMSGDPQLWPSLTAAQQRRAILFLKSGSTIRSSLQGD